MKVIYKGLELSLTVNEFCQLLNKGIFDETTYDTGINQNELKDILDKWKDHKIKEPSSPQKQVICVYGCPMPDSTDGITYTTDIVADIRSVKKPNNLDSINEENKNG